MNIFLGNVLFSEVEEKLGYSLNDSDKELWDEFHNDKADLSGMESCFHVFDMPRCIQVKGKQAKDAIIKMFTSDKNTNPKGRFPVYEK